MIELVGSCVEGARKCLITSKLLGPHGSLRGVQYANSRLGENVWRRGARSCSLVTTRQNSAVSITSCSQYLTSAHPEGSPLRGRAR